MSSPTDPRRRDATDGGGPTRRRVIGAGCALALVLTVWAANLALERWGFVPVGFGYLAPAGVYFAGLAFVLRDLTHEAAGRWVVLAAILSAHGWGWWPECGRGH